MPGMGLAAVERDSPSGDPVERCHVIGYPAFKERVAPDGGQLRETADALGDVSVLSGLARGLLSVQVRSAPRLLPPAQVRLGDSPWSGMSGGPVVADGYLVAVVTEHAAREGESAIVATPLTALEPDPAHPGWGPGVPNPGAWWTRMGVSGLAALKRLPVPRRAGEPEYWATVAEIRQRTGTLISRQDELAQIASFAIGDQGYWWLTGDAWAGKTSLLAEAVATLPGDIDAACYFLSRREADADSSRFLAAVVPQLAFLLEEDSPAPAVHHFRSLWQRAASRASSEGRHLLLVVDGLDEDLHLPGLPSVAALLPAGTGGRAHVLVSSRTHSGLPSDVPPGHPLRGAWPTHVKPFSGSRESAVLARQEIDDLLRRHDDGLAADVLGLLTAAAGPLAVRDLAAMTIAAPHSAALTRQIRKLLTSSAARSLEATGLAGQNRYQFAHETLLAHAQANDDLSDPDFRRRVHQWAQEWHAAGWPVLTSGQDGTPLYLLDTYAATLAQEPQRLAQLVSDAGWIGAVIASVGVDRVLAELRGAAAANPASTHVAAALATVIGQVSNLRPVQPLDQPGYILRQLWMQASDLGEDDLAEDIRNRLQSWPRPSLVPQWTTRRQASPALSADLGRHDGRVEAVVVLADGRVVSGGNDGRVLIWDPTYPGSGPAQLGYHDTWEKANPGTQTAELGHHGPGVNAVVVMPDGRVATGGNDGRMLLWDPVNPGGGPIELGCHNAAVRTVAALNDGQVVSGGADWRVLLWDPVHPGTGPIELGHHSALRAVTALADGRAATCGHDGRVLLWDPVHPGAEPVELGHHNAWVKMVAGLADGRVATSEFFGPVEVWDPADPGAEPIELFPEDAHVEVMAELMDGRIATAGYDGRVLVWDPAEPSTGPVELGRHDEPTRTVAALADGRIVTGGDDWRVLVWDTAHPGVSLTQTSRHDDFAEAAATLTDGRVATTGESGRVLVWDPAEPGTEPVELGRHEGLVLAVAALADGRVVTGGYDHRVLVWDPAEPGTNPLELGHHMEPVMVLAALADGRVVTGGQDHRVLVWDPAEPGTNPLELGHHDSWPDALAALGDGRVITGHEDGQVLVWNPADPDADPVGLGRLDSSVRVVTVLPDGRVVTGGSDGRLLVWDPTEPGTQPAELGRHDGPVWVVTVLPDGRVVSGGSDNRVLVWDPAASGNHLIELTCWANALAATSYGPARSNLLIAHNGGGLSYWSFIE